MEDENHETERALELALRYQRAAKGLWWLLEEIARNPERAKSLAQFRHLFGLTTGPSPDHIQVLDPWTHRVSLHPPHPMALPAGDPRRDEPLVWMGDFDPLAHLGEVLAQLHASTPAMPAPPANAGEREAASQTLMAWVGSVEGPVLLTREEVQHLWAGARHAGLRFAAKHPGILARLDEVDNEEDAPASTGDASVALRLDGVTPSPANPRGDASATVERDDEGFRIVLQRGDTRSSWSVAEAEHLGREVDVALAKIRKTEEIECLKGWEIEHHGDWNVLRKGEARLHLSRYGGTCRLYPRPNDYAIAETKIEVTDCDTMRILAAEWANAIEAGTLALSG